MARSHLPYTAYFSLPECFMVPSTAPDGKGDIPEAIPGYFGTVNSYAQNSQQTLRMKPDQPAMDG